MMFHKFNPNMSDNDFVNYIIQLDAIDDGTLHESDDDRLSDFYDNLYKVCPIQINNNLNNSTYLLNRSETIGEFMNFLKNINL